MHLSQIKVVLMVLFICLTSFVLCACDSSYSSYSNVTNASDYDRKYDASEFQGAKDVWNAINGN